MTISGDVVVSLELSAGLENKKNYENIYQFVVKDNTKIGQTQIIAKKNIP